MIGAIVQAIEDDASRSALTDRKSLLAANIFDYVPSSYNLRRAMISLELRDGLREVSREISKHIYSLERWYAIDATSFPTRYCEKRVWVHPEDGPPIYEKMKTCKLFAARGLVTGVVAEMAVTDYNINDQDMFVPIFRSLIDGGAIVRGGGGILADAGFNKRDHYELVASFGGQPFLDFDRNAVPSKDDHSVFNQQLKLYREQLDRWYTYYDPRALIESTNHGIKSIKRAIRARTELARENEILALVAGFNLSRLPELRLTSKIDLPFVDAGAVAFIDEAVRAKRRKAALGSVEIAMERELSATTLFGPYNRICKAM